MDCRCLSYAEKPSENCEDLQYVEAIREAKENVGDLKLKSAKDYTVPKHLRMNAERTRAQLIGLEKNVHTNKHTHVLTLFPFRQISIQSGPYEAGSM